MDITNTEDNTIKTERKETLTGYIITTHYPAGLLHKTLPVTQSISITDWKKWDKYMDSMVTIP